MQFSKAGILRNKIEQIGQYALLDTRTLSKWETRAGEYAAPGRYAGVEEAWTRMDVGASWLCGDGVTRWFRTAFTIPEAWKGKPVILLLDFGGEGLVRLNGQIQSAVTSYVPHGLAQDRQQRERVMVTPCAEGGETYTLEAECSLNFMEYAAYREAGRTSVSYVFSKALLAAVDLSVEAYFYDAKALLEAVEVLDCPFDAMRRGNVRLPAPFATFMAQNSKDPYLYTQMLDVLQRALCGVDIDFDRDALARSIPGASRTLREGLAAISWPSPGHMILTGHAHIDTAWLWPVKETVRKAARTFANALSLMDAYPEYVFAHSQPWQYAAIQKHYPELWEQVKRRVQQGRWELLGNSWVEVDANIPSGEALVRQLLYGRRFFLKEFGRASDVYWMPDVFGYSWSLPQIIMRSGMQYFYTAKLLNNDINRFPYSLFLWQGIDGTRVPAYLQRVNYNGEITPQSIDTMWREFDEKDKSPLLFQTFGYGDGGGGPTHQMLEYAQRMKAMPGFAKTSVGQTGDFFHHLPAEDLPVWNDEIYYEFHRGTYTSQAQVKQNNRKGELALRRAEMVCTFASIAVRFAYPMEALAESWKLVLLNQFHDIIPGSSIHAVYEDAARDYAQAFALCRQAEQPALQALTAAISTESDSVVVYNFLSWPRNGMVHVELPEGLETMGVEGAAYTHARKSGRTTLSFLADHIPAMGYRAYRLSAAPAASSPAAIVKATPCSIENDLLRIALDENGLLERIYDKQAGRDVLKPGQVGNLLTVFEDKPERESAWNIDIEYQNKAWPLMRAESIQVLPDSPLWAGVRIVRRFHLSTVTQVIRLYPGSRRIDFETEVQWQETEKMLKASFPVDILSTRAAYEIAYGAIERPTHTNTSWDLAKFEVPAHKWADLSEGDYGVALLNDCKYGYDIHAHTLRITLLRSPVYPDPTADKGTHTFVYALYPHLGTWRDGDVVRAGYELNVPLLPAVTGAHAASLPDSGSFLTVEADQVVLEAVKQAEDGDGIILRVYESKGSRCRTGISLHFPASEVWETNLMEEKEQACSLENGRFQFFIKPYEIKTFFIFYKME